jgi:hypothetical protein
MPQPIWSLRFYLHPDVSDCQHQCNILIGRKTKHESNREFLDAPGGRHRSIWTSFKLNKYLVVSSISSITLP